MWFAPSFLKLVFSGGHVDIKIKYTFLKASGFILFNWEKQNLFFFKKIKV